MLLRLSSVHIVSWAFSRCKHALAQFSFGVTASAAKDKNELWALGYWEANWFQYALSLWFASRTVGC